MGQRCNRGVCYQSDGETVMVWKLCTRHGWSSHCQHDCKWEGLVYSTGLREAIAAVQWEMKSIFARIKRETEAYEAEQFADGVQLNAILANLSL